MKKTVKIYMRLVDSHYKPEILLVTYSPANRGWWLAYCAREALLSLSEIRSELEGYTLIGSYREEA